MNWKPIVALIIEYLKHTVITVLLLAALVLLILSMPLWAAGAFVAALVLAFALD